MYDTQAEIIFYIRSSPTAHIPTAQFMMYVIILLELLTHFNLCM